MPAALVSIDLPLAGVNMTDEARDLLPGQAESLANFRLVGNGLESLRGAHVLPGASAFTFQDHTNDILVYRSKTGTVGYFYAAEGTFYEKATADGSLITSGLLFSTVTAPIRIVQAGDWVLLFNGVDRNWLLNVAASRFLPMGCHAPALAPDITASPLGTETRDYYYTFYDPITGLESNPSPVKTYTQAANPLTVRLYPTGRQSDETAFTDYRVYRTGIGITVPRLVGTVAGAASTIYDYTDTSDDDDVSVADRLRFDHDPAPVFRDAAIINNRLFGWGDPDNPSTVWVSNEGEYAYFPLVPFLDKTEATSGGPIDIRTGDNQSVQAVVPWGGQAIALKQQVSYRISQSDVGFYSYQHMMNEGTPFPRSPVVTGEGLMFLTRRGWMLLTNDEQLVDVGAPVRAVTQTLDPAGAVVSATARGIVMVAFKHAGAYQYLTYTPGAGWQGPHPTPVSCFFEDVDGNVYGGRCDLAGFQKMLLFETGVLASELQEQSLFVAWATGALDFGAPDRYKRLREVRLTLRELSAGDPQTLTFRVYDDLGNIRDLQSFTVTGNGVVSLGCANSAQGEFLQVTVSGTLTRPIRISRVQAFVEMGATL